MHRVIHASIQADREQNEDAKIVDRDRNIYIIADGIGGERGGKEASALAAFLVYQELKELDAMIKKKRVRQEDIGDLLVSCIDYTNNMLAATGKSVPEVKGFGTTLDVCYLNQGHAYIGHVGDSAVYVVHRSDKTIEKLTTDHSTYVNNESLSPDENFALGLSTPITSWIGRGTPYEKQLITLPFSEEDILFLATDGLIKTVTEEEIIASLISEHPRQDLLTLVRKPVQMKERYSRLREAWGENYPAIRMQRGDNTTFIAIYGGQDNGERKIQKTRNHTSDKGSWRILFHRTKS